MTASGRAFSASSGMISGVGLASAMMSGFRPMRATMSGLCTPPAERPRKMSAPSMTSARLRSLVSCVYGAFDIGNQDVLAPRAERDEQIEAGERRSASAGGYDLDVGNALAAEFQSVAHRRRHDDRSAVLIVVEHRDLHALLEAALDLEALGRLEVLKVDAAKGRLERSTTSTAS